jgi:hypothetical protein
MTHHSDISGFPFKSALTRKAAGLAALGFLAGLGFVPGWERLFGFSGFFGFIGIALIIEFAAWRKSRSV